MGGLIAATRWTNVAWSFHPTDFLLRPRLSSRSRWQSTCGDELTGVFIYFSPVSVQLGSFYEWKQLTSRQVVFISMIDDLNLQRHNKYASLIHCDLHHHPPGNDCDIPYWKRKIISSAWISRRPSCDTGGSREAAIVCVEATWRQRLHDWREGQWQGAGNRISHAFFNWATFPQLRSEIKKARQKKLKWRGEFTRYEVMKRWVYQNILQMQSMHPLQVTHKMPFWLFVDIGALGSWSKLRSLNTTVQKWYRTVSTQIKGSHFNSFYSSLEKEF